MKEEFVSYEIANKLKEKGFKEECLAYYSKDSDFYYNTSYDSNVENAFKSFNSRPNHICGKRTDAPTISQVLKWLREKKHTYLYVDVCKAGYFFEVKCLRSFYMINTTFFDKHKSYEQAALAGIEYVIDNLI